MASTASTALNAFAFNNNHSEFRFFYYAPNEDNFYHITCKNIQNSFPEHDSDHTFFYQGPTEVYHVTCKLLPRSIILKILNEELYGISVGGSSENLLISLDQQFNLEQDLKYFLDSHLSNNFPQHPSFDDQNYNGNNSLCNDYVNNCPYPQQVHFDNFNYDTNANGNFDNDATDINQNDGYNGFGHYY